MSSYQPTDIQLHMVTGDRRLFFQENADLVAKICDDLDGRIFTRPSLIIESAGDIFAIPGVALIGITVITDPLPESFLRQEKLSNTIINQISEEAFQFRRRQTLSKTEGQRSPIISEIEFVDGERVYLEFSEVAESGLGERSALHHLFTHPSIACRCTDGGFSIWNTVHIVSWSHYPKLEVPANAWLAEPLVQHATERSPVIGVI